jgi:5-methylcytosine-specific restriction protein A
MAVIKDLKPSASARVIDLVAAAGHDVSDWKNFKGGLPKEGSNPKYCYEWAFVQPGRAVVLNLWYKDLQITDGNIVQCLNYRQHTLKLPQVAAHGTWVKRAKAIDDAFALAANQALPVRVIVCDGKRRDVINNPEKSSSVSRRMLDPIPWSVTSYDPATGDCTITRGSAPVAVEDQFSNSASGDNTPVRRTVTTESFVRDSLVRRRVRERAKGFCEYCSQAGFTMSSGAAYVETHHIVSLSSGGADSDVNVIALCPNDHRRAHHAADQESLGAQFQRIVSAKLKLVQ